MAKRKAAPKPRRSRRAPPTPEVLCLVPETETAQEAVVGIARDAVVILRRELAWRAQVSMQTPGMVSMVSLVALLRLVSELGPTARGEAGAEQQASYDRLSPEERVQLAALLLKVEYS